MVYEYAVDPNSLYEWSRLRLIADGVGVPKGRLVAEYPGTWKKTVMQLLSGKLPIERSRLVSQYQRIKPHLIHPHRLFDSGHDWLINAETVQEASPFQAIVAAENPRARDYILKIDELDDTITLWRTSPNAVVERKAASMANAVRFLLQLAYDVVLVDKNFVPGPRFLRPFGQFMECCRGTRNLKPPRIRLIVEADGAVPNDPFERNCALYLAPLIPSSMSCEVIRVREKISPAEKLHNRYILTDRGGVQFGVGLDDADGDEGQTDDVTLLSQDSFDRRWRQYAQSQGFDMVCQLTIAGTKV
jgi:hypothetical protein